MFLANCPGSRVEELVATTVLSGSRGGELLVELDFCLGVLGHGLDHEVGIGDGLGHVELKLEAIVCRVDAGEAGVLVQRLIGVRDAGAPRAGPVGHGLDGIDIGLAELVDLWLGAAD